MDNHLHLKINMRCMYTLGVFKLKLKSTVLTWIHWFYSNLVKIFFITFLTTQYIEVCRILNEELFSIVANLAVSLLYSVTILKYFACNGKNIKLLVKQIYDTETKIMGSGSDDLKRIYMRHVQWNYFVDKLLIWVGVFTVLPYFVTPILEEKSMEPEMFNITSNNVTEQYLKRPLPFSAWFPFNKYKYYYVSYCVHILYGSIGGSITVSTDIFFVGLMVFARGQIKTLQHMLRNSKSLAMEMTNADKNLTYDQAIRYVIGHSITLHKIIIKYIKDLNASMKTLMLFDFAIASMQMAMIGLRIITVGVGVSQAFAVEFLGAMLIQLFLFYWHANEILLESLAIPTAIWESEWFEYTQDTKKSLLLVMMRCQRPLILSVGPFYNMSTETMISILRAAYTYVAVIRQMYSRET